MPAGEISMKHVLSALAVCALAGSACGGSDNSTPNFVTPTPALITESFTGTVAIGGTDFHTFSVGSAGTVSVTLTAAGPPPTIYMGLGVGTPGASACVLLTNGSVAVPAGMTAQLSGTISAGSYCVSVFDIGNQTVDVTYAVTVTHY
jgi:hypothetical protein